MPHPLRKMHMPRGQWRSDAQRFHQKSKEPTRAECVYGKTVDQEPQGPVAEVVRYHRLRGLTVNETVMYMVKSRPDLTWTTPAAQIRKLAMETMRGNIGD